MIIRIQSSQGTKRLDISDNESVSSLLSQTRELFGLSVTNWTLCKGRNQTDPLAELKSKSVKAAGIKHGDMLYLFIEEGTSTKSSPAEEQKPPSFGSSIGSLPMDDIDELLLQLDGKIQRKADPTLCHCGPLGRCLHCIPLEPYDENYHRQNDIKYLSFHSYLRKLRDERKLHSLILPQCAIKPGCRGHPAWPVGICTKCQPSALTLNRQTFRHVDNISFENVQIAEEFMRFWRQSGLQRSGYLIGKYEPHKEVPLGIKAVISAIYEPPQENTSSSITLLDDPHEALVDRIAQQLGLRRVGWIFSDLTPEDVSKGTVKYTRGAVDTYILSTEECITAAFLQNKYTNPCRLSPEGCLGSKFVTVVVTGDSNLQVAFEGFQVSNQTMALVRDQCLVPTFDAPELGYIRESSSAQFVPDVFYKEKDQYGNEVTQIARPFPVEYLIIDVPAAVNKDPVHTFNHDSPYITDPFPVENRDSIGETQDLARLGRYLLQAPAYRLLEALTNFHVLLFLAKQDTVPLASVIDDLLTAIRDRDAVAFEEWQKNDQWRTLYEVLLPFTPGAEAGAGQQAGALWPCQYCTFLNSEGSDQCAVCSLPK